MEIPLTATEPVDVSSILAVDESRRCVLLFAFASLEEKKLTRRIGQEIDRCEQGVGGGD